MLDTTGKQDKTNLNERTILPFTPKINLVYTKTAITTDNFNIVRLMITLIPH